MITESSAKSIVCKFIEWAATATSPTDSVEGLFDPRFSLDIIGRTPVSGHYENLVSVFNVLLPLIHERIAAADYKIVNTLSTPEAIAAQLEVTATTKTGEIYNPRRSLSTLVLTLCNGLIIHARYWPDTEQLERVIFGSTFS